MRPRVETKCEVYLSECKEPLLVANAGALDHHVILLHLAVVGEPTHWIDRFVSQIIPESTANSIRKHQFFWNLKILQSIRG